MAAVQPFSVVLFCLEGFEYILKNILSREVRRIFLIYRFLVEWRPQFLRSNIAFSEHIGKSAAVIKPIIGSRGQLHSL